MRKRIAILSFLFILTVTAMLAVPLNEGFENEFPPLGWTNTMISHHAWTANSQYYAGSYAAGYEGTNYSGEGILMTPRLDLTSNTSDELSFWYKAAVWGSDQNVLYVELSSDGGLNWTEVDSLNNAQAYEFHTYNLESYDQTDNSFIRFRAIDEYGYYTLIDNVMGPDLYVDTTIPGVIADVVPENNALDIALSPTLSWSFGISTETYDLFLDTVNPPVTRVVADGIAGINGSYTPVANLNENTTYYWQVISKNSITRFETVNSVNSFTTILGENVISIGTGTTVDMSIPIDPYFNYSYSQVIYLQSEIDRPNQRIEKISYHYNQYSSLANNTEWVIYMAHTSNTSFASTTDWLPITDFVEVYNGSLPTIQADGWIQFVLDTPFTYNNTDNLVIAVEENSSSCDSNSDEFFCTTTDEVRGIAYRSDSTNPNPLTPPTASYIRSAIANIRMEFGELSPFPGIAINPSSYDFGIIFTGLDSDSQTFTIQNTGGGDLIIDTPITLETGSHFTLTDLNTYPLTIAPTMNATISITYNATTEGLVTDNIIVIDNVTRETNLIPIQGTGFNAVVSVFPFTQSFDTSSIPVGWTVDPVVASDSWETYRGASGDYAAYSEHTENDGYMMYVDDSTPETVPAHLYTPEFNFSSVASPFLSFWYWIGRSNATNTTELHIDVITSDSTVNTVEVVTSPNGQSDWAQAVINLSDYAGETIQLDFRAVESTGYNGDICIDDIYIFNNTNPPANSTLVAPNDGVNQQLLSGMLEWTEVIYADGYDLYLGTDNPPTNIINGTDQGTSLSYDYSELQYATTYYWQVVPYNNNGDATNCPIWSFETVGALPAAVTPIYPADEATGVDFSVELQWNTSIVAEGYYLNFGTDNPPTSVENMTDMANATSYDTPNLIGNTVYYWQIIPYNTNGNAVDCPIWSFITYADTPAEIAMTAPLDLATGISEYTTFTWETDDWALGYNLYIATDGVNYVQTDVGNLTGVTLTTPLNYETMYYWYVTGYNSNGESPAPVVVRTFTVQSNPNFGGDGVLYGGYYFANSTDDGNGLGFQPTFEWNDISATGTSITTLTDDSVVTGVSIGFTFNYYGVDYTELGITSNGSIQFSGFDSGWSAHADLVIPDSAVPNNVIAFAAMDSNPLDVPSVYYYGNDAEGNFVFTVEMFNDYDETDENMDVQVVLYPNGRIKIQYRNYVNPNGDTGLESIAGDACIGIENADGTVGLQYRNNGVGGPMLNDLAVVFATTAEDLAEPVAALDTPANIVLTYSEGLMNLTWDAVTGATLYNVYVAETPDFAVDGATFFQSVATNALALDPSLLPGSHYFVKVTADDSIIRTNSYTPVRRSYRTYGFVKYIKPTIVIEKAKK